jgi:hypothetical protein
MKNFILLVNDCWYSISLEAPHYPPSIWHINFFIYINLNSLLKNPTAMLSIMWWSVLTEKIKNVDRLTMMNAREYKK